MKPTHTDMSKYGELVTIIDQSWGLYLHNEKEDWIGLVLVAPWEPRTSHRRPRKKTFWLGWSRVQQRLSRKTDLRALQKRHEKIYYKLLEVCLREWPKPER
jgi:hypothetical protein